MGRRPHRGQAVALVGCQLAVEHEIRHADDAVHRRSDLVAHVREELALRPARFHRPVAGVHQFQVAGLEFGRARIDRALEIVLLREQLKVALLDVGEHGVELIDQLADLVLVAVLRADVVAAAVAHQARHRDQSRDRVEDQPRGRPRQTERNPERAKQRAGGNRRETGQPGPNLRGVGIHGDAADNLVVQRNRPDHAQPATLVERDGLEARRRGFVRPQGSRGQPRTDVGGQQCTIAREQTSRENVLVDRCGAKRIGRRRRVFEGQRRGAVGPDDVGENRDIADQPHSQVDVVVRGEDGARRDQRDAAGEERGRRELASHRLAAEPCAEATEHDHFE